VGLLFLGYSTKTQFWVTKWDGMLYEVIIQYWVWEGQGWIWIYGRPRGVCCLSADSAGGVLILSRWKSALLQKISLFERLLTQVRDFLKRF